MTTRHDVGLAELNEHVRRRLGEFDQPRWVAPFIHSEGNAVTEGAGATVVIRSCGVVDGILDAPVKTRQSACWSARLG